MVRRRNLNNPLTIGSIGYAAASVNVTGEVYLYPCEEGLRDCAPIGF